MSEVGHRQTQTVVDPRTGVAFTVEDAEGESLVVVLIALRERLAQMKEWEQAVNDELVRRHKGRRAPLPVGAYEVDVDVTRSREWDAEALEWALRDLVDRGVLGAHEIEGIVIVSKRVDGKKALALLNDLDGEALTMVRDCFTWKQGRPKAKVTATAVLEP